MSVILTDDLAKIAIAKNLVKEYLDSDSKRTVYLNDGTEFQIYLKNPYQNHLGIKIYVNNKSIGNMLVLKPGQSIWLDRYVNENSKFLFSTYNVENTPEMKYAISNNGKVKIEFYHEKEEPQYRLTTLTYTPSHPYTYDGNGYFTTATGNNIYYNTSYDVSATTLNSNLSLTSSGVCGTEFDNSIETGRVEKGSRSNQEFDYCDISFDTYPFKTEHIHILPVSQKQVRPEEMRRKYCSQCGKKVRPKDKFCSNCGAKLI